MGLLSTPLRGLLSLFEEIARRADDELNDDEAVKAELMALHASLEAGSITEEAFEEKELALVTRLSEIEDRKAGQRPPAPSRAARTRPRAAAPRRAGNRHHGLH